MQASDDGRGLEAGVVVELAGDGGLGIRPDLCLNGERSVDAVRLNVAQSKRRTGNRRVEAGFQH